MSEETKPVALELRVCNTCAAKKPINEFADKFRSGDHKRHRCRSCHAIRIKPKLDALNKSRLNDEYRAKRREYIRTHISGTEPAKQRSRKHAKVYREKYPEKQAAKRLVRAAIQSGKLVRPLNCSQCGNTDKKRIDGGSTIHAHHEDYSKPLDVIWLCIACHTKAHAKPPITSLGVTVEGAAK